MTHLIRHTRGFKELVPNFAIRDAGSDENRLPTASTCVNLLKARLAHPFVCSHHLCFHSSFLDTTANEPCEKSFSRLFSQTQDLTYPEQRLMSQTYLFRNTQSWNDL